MINAYLCRFLAALIATLSFSAAANAQSTSLQNKQEALSVIGRFARDICNNPELKGRSTATEAAGKAKAEVNKLVKKLVDLEISGAVKITELEYEGLLQKDLLPALLDAGACRERIYKDLVDRFLPKSLSSNARPEFIIERIQDNKYPEYSYVIKNTGGRAFNILVNWVETVQAGLIIDGNYPGLPFATYAVVGFGPYHFTGTQQWTWLRLNVTPDNLTRLASEVQSFAATNSLRGIPSANYEYFLYLKYDDDTGATHQRAWSLSMSARPRSADLSQDFFRIRDARAFEAENKTLDCYRNLGNMFNGDSKDFSKLVERGLSKAKQDIRIC